MSNGQQQKVALVTGAARGIGLAAAQRFLAEQGVDFLTYLKQGADMAFIDSLDAGWSGALPATVLYDGSGRKLARRLAH